MQFSEFIGKVQNRAKLSSEDEALRATRVTLETLAQRIGGKEPEHIAAQLPEEIGRFLKNDKKQERFDLSEFFQRVSQGEGVDPAAAAFHARVVIEVLQEAVTGGEIDDVRTQLPDDYQMLFEAGSSGDLKQ
jgi:uncharacterized protein (DUF2267 family)